MKKSNEKRVEVSFGEVYVIPEDNVGRGITGTASEEVLATQRRSIRDSGLVSAIGSPITITDGIDSEIVEEVGKRKLTLQRLRAELEAAQSGDKEAQKLVPFCRAMLDVSEYYYLTGNGQIVKPKYRQLTGNQRHSQYLEAMADRLVLIREVGFSGATGRDTWEFANPGNLDNRKIQAKDVCQEVYTVEYVENLSKADQFQKQLEENSAGFGLGEISTLDRAYNIFRQWVANGVTMTQAEVIKRAKVAYGIGQTVFLICRLAWALKDTEYDIFARCKLPADDDEYRNPLVWAGTGGQSALNATQSRLSLAQLDPVALAKVNSDRKSKKLGDPLPQITTAELIEELEDMWLAHIEAEPAVKGLTWQVAEDSAVTQLVKGYIAACRANTVGKWQSDNARLLEAVGKLEAEAEAARVKSANAKKGKNGKPKVEAEAIEAEATEAEATEAEATEVPAVNVEATA